MVQLAAATRLENLVWLSTNEIETVLQRSPPASGRKGLDSVSYPSQPKFRRAVQ
jgi:hypothetical protein